MTDGDGTGRGRPAVELDRVTKAFGGLVAVADVTLDVAARERLAVIGPNGAGKTTLFHLISGELRASSGTIHLFGQEVTGLAPHRRVALGLRRTYQITNLFPALSVEQNLLLGFYGLTTSKFDVVRPVPTRGRLVEAARAALAHVGLEGRARVPARELSHGEQRQLELALALACEPKLLLLDEPGAGLSAAERAAVGAIIRIIPPEVTLILIEHDMDLALSLVDRVVCLHNGRVIARGTPDEIRRNDAVQEVYLGVPA